MKLFHYDDLEENQSKAYEIDDLTVFAVKRDGRIFLYENLCPHLGINLEFQQDVFLDLDNHFIQCANHGALFEVESGECISGPCNGQFLTAYPFTIKDQFICVDK